MDLSDVLSSDPHILATGHTGILSPVLHASPFIAVM